MVWIIIGIIISYLIGSFPTAYLFGRLLKGIDIRKFGSGNVGATNAWRVLGKSAGITVLALDILKGFVTVSVLAKFIALKTGYALKIDSVAVELLLITMGLFCILGHSWTVFLNFKGGKGIATTLGVLLALALRIAGFKLVLAATLLAWIVIFAVTRIVSLASILAAIFLPLFTVFFNQSKILIITTLILSLLTIFRHKANIKRLLQGKEPTLKSK